MTRDKLFIALTVGIVLLSAVLSLYHLDNCYLWQDEAFNAFVASNYVRTGHLSCWDGRNLCAELHGSVLRNDLSEPVQATLDFAAVIASFKMLGISTFAARLPSALFALVGLIAFLALLRLEFPGKRSLILFSLALLAFSVQYLLNARTCRYYAYIGLFSLLMYYCYRRFAGSRGWPHALGIAVSAVLLFYTHPLGGIAFILALLVVHTLFHQREFTGKDWAKIGFAALLFLATTVPYVCSGELWTYGRSADSGGHHHGLADLRTHLWLVWLNVRDLNISNCLPWTCAAGVVVLFAISRKNADVQPVIKAIIDWASLVLLYAVFLALLSAPSQVSMEVATLRYFAPVLPFMCGITGAFVWMVYRISRPAAIALCLVIISTNIMTLTPFPYEWVPATDQPRSLLPAFIGEITPPYPTSDEVVCNFLRREARPDDIVVNLPYYHAVTMDFYLGDLVHTGALLDERCPVRRDIIEGLNTPLYVNETFPDWIVFYGLSANEGSHLSATLDYYSRPHTVDGKTVAYHYAPAKRCDVYWTESNRSELLFHSFGPPKVNDPNDAVYIYARAR